MAARYVDTAIIVAQGQSFYTGLLPGSYEKGAGGGGSNVMGKGSGGTAGVSADRTGSEAALQSITGYKAGGSILGTQPMSDSDLLEQIAKNTAPGGQGGGQGQNPQGQHPAGLPTPGGPQGQNPNPAAGLPWGTNQAPNTDPGPMGTGQKSQHQGGGFAKGAGTAVGLGVGAGVTARTGKPILGKMAGAAAGAITEHGVGKMEDKLSESPIGRSVQKMASTRSHTRQPGVQQSATQQSIPFPNMANSTDRSLNF